MFYSQVTWSVNDFINLSSPHHPTNPLTSHTKTLRSHFTQQCVQFRKTAPKSIESVNYRTAFSHSSSHSSTLGPRFELRHCQSDGESCGLHSPLSISITPKSTPLLPHLSTRSSHYETAIRISPRSNSPSPSTWIRFSSSNVSITGLVTIYMISELGLFVPKGRSSCRVLAIHLGFWGSLMLLLRA